MDYYVPEETEVLLRNRASECKNLGLLLDKYMPISVFEKPDKNDKNKGKTPWLTRILEPTSVKDKGKKQNRHIDAELAQHVYQRWKAMTRVIGARRFQATLDWRMVIGLGGETVLETDLTLHHLYGIPYVPASALKGLTRAYVTGEVFPSGNIEDDNDTVKRIFGTQKEAGTVLFFDAMPVEGQATFVLDIMNPHYPDYYRSKQNPPPPTNDQSPNPVTFLTVADTTFMFALAPRNSHVSQHRKDVENVEEWLRLALEKYGIGGKTSAGYGYFKVTKDEPKHESKDEPKLETVLAAKPPSPPPSERKPVELPPLQVNQEIMGVVATEAQRNDLLRRFPTESSSVFLIYRDTRNRDYSPDDVVILVSTAEYPELQNWKTKEQRKCQIAQIEKRGDSTVLICKPVRSKFADKKKR